jgi:hypothetical protein
VSEEREASLRPTEHEVEAASELMLRFAERTGLGSDRAPQRYLWTDAFAVCNYLALGQVTGASRYLQLALGLVDQVHRVLGRHRGDDGRSGWISGLGDREAALHPTRGGLRIGKPLPERSRGAPIDEHLEWDRDGQYFHYLTKWMHALDQVARETREVRFDLWARELAEVAHRAFTCASGGGRRMVWKMSIDLSRPLVSSMGQHDPLDGLVTCLQLRATAASLSEAPREPSLDTAVSDFAILIRGRSLATADPLGLGGLLMDAARVAQLIGQDALAECNLLETLLAAASAGLAHFERENDLRQPASRRLAFRELGLAIGLAALGPIGQALEAGSSEFPDRARIRARLDALGRHAALGSGIVDFWREPERRQSRLWAEHGDINDVMLATSLVPEGALVVGPANARNGGRG